MQEYLECFDLSQPAIITIFVDQPIANSELVISASDGVGHTFIGISQNGNRSVFGFYPSGSAGPVFPSDPGIMGNDSAHPWDVSITVNITAPKLQQIINLSINYPQIYDLNDYNCTDFGIDIANICGLNFPDCNSSWVVGSGSNPARLGQYIRETYPINGYYNVNKSGGTAPPTIKNCD